MYHMCITLSNNVIYSINKHSVLFIIYIYFCIPQQRGDPVIIYNNSIIDVAPFPLDVCCEVADIEEKAQELRYRTESKE